MISQPHKYLLAGLVLGVLAYWVWQKRSHPGNEGG